MWTGKLSKDAYELGRQEGTGKRAWAEEEMGESDANGFQTKEAVSVFQETRSDQLCRMLLADQDEVQEVTVWIGQVNDIHVQWRGKVDGRKLKREWKEKWGQ